MTEKSESRHRRLLIGTVLQANKTPNTLIVSVVANKRHGFYEKFLRQRKKYHVHYLGKDVQLGDKVEIRECRPMSATKKFTFSRIVSKSQGGFAEEVPS